MKSNGGQVGWRSRKQERALSFKVLFCSVFAALGFELRASHLLGRCRTT
jgi:hypothetical protein